MRHMTTRKRAIRCLLLGGCLLVPVAAAAAEREMTTYPAAAGVLPSAAPGALAEATGDIEADPALVPDLNLPAREGDNAPHGGVEAGVVDAALKAIPAPRPGSKTINREFVDQVFAEICRQGIREPQIVMRQALLETGWMRAPFLMKRNNLFGFRYRTYLTFDSWQHSVRYYRDWQARRYKASDASYYAFLKRIRYGAPTYLQHLDKMAWNKPCPPSPLQSAPLAAPAAPLRETLAYPTLPDKVEAIVPPLIKPAPGAAPAEPVSPLAPDTAPAR